MWLWDPKHPPEAYRYLPTGRRFWRQEARLVLPVVLALAVLARAGLKQRTDTWIPGLFAAVLVLTFRDAVWADAASYARVTSVVLLLALRSFAEAPEFLGAGLPASLPFGYAAALAWCTDSWVGWQSRPG